MRAEAYYFAPQRQTKILNEGWASYWHSKIMTEKALKASEIIDYADHNAGVLSTAPGQFNPYKVGIEPAAPHRGALGQGPLRQGVERVRRLRDPAHLGQAPGPGAAEDLRGAHASTTTSPSSTSSSPRTSAGRTSSSRFSLNERSGNYEIDSREFQKVKHKILFQLTNFGEPFIFVEDANHDNRGELLLRHRHEGTDLHDDHARATLTALERIWRRPVNLRTVLDGKAKLLRFDGKEHSEKAG